MSIGFPISDGNGHGTDPATMRRILGAHWANVGVIDGCTVTTSSSGLTYTVAAGRAVSTRGTTYGKVEFEVPASTVTTTAGPQSGSRIDVVWAKPNDPSQGDANADVVVGVTNGTASTSTPSKPTIPTGALELRTYLVPQGATKTSQATVQGSVNYAIPYGGSLGILDEVKDTATAFGGDITVGSISFYLPTDRLVRFEMVTSATAVQKNTGTPLTYGSMYQRLYIDGVMVREIERALSGAANTDVYTESFVLTAGNHTASMRLLDGISGWKRYYGPGVTGRPGQRLRAVDEGVAQ